MFRNGFSGTSRIVQQGWRGGHLCTMLQCACGLTWRLPTLADALPVLEYLEGRAQSRERDADRNGTEGDRELANGFWREIARRIVAGYLDDPTAAAEMLDTLVGATAST